MSIKLIGRTTDFKGKTLWEILGNLKDFGVGRIVVRSTSERFPEKSFLKVVKVQTVPQEKDRKIKVWVEKTFRGRKIEKIWSVFSSSYKADYRLIPKDEEEEYCKIEKVHEPRVISDKLECPPFLKLWLKQNAERKGIEFPDDFVFELKTNHKKTLSNYRPPKEGEELPIIKCGVDKLDAPVYKDIKV